MASSVIGIIVIFSFTVAGNPIKNVSVGILFELTNNTLLSADS